MSSIPVAGLGGFALGGVASAVTSALLGKNRKMKKTSFLVGLLLRLLFLLIFGIILLIAFQIIKFLILRGMI